MTARLSAAARTIGWAMRAWPPHVGALAIRASYHQGRSEWEPARIAWAKALATLRLYRMPTRRLFARYLLNMAMCEFFLGKLDDAATHLEEAAVSDAVVNTPEYTLLKARLVRRRDNAQAASLLRAEVTRSPDNLPVLYEFCSVALDGPNPAEALPVAERLTRLAPNDVSFRILSCDLAERSGQWLRALAGLRELVALQPDDAEANKRLVLLSGTLGDIRAARSAALAFSRRVPGEFAIWQSISDIYERAGMTAKARLVVRFLMRRWPHSRWHKLKYAELLAAAGKLNAADRILASVPLGEADAEAAYNQSLWRVARSAGGRHETLARLKHLRNQGPVDFGFDIDYGYALADVEGAEAARDHFYELSIRSRFDRRALHGLAHMAVRDRLASATLAAWRRAAEIHPDDHYAVAEYCRSLLETGAGDKAIALCRARYEDFQHDRGFVEFFVWLSTAVGAFEETRRFCEQKLGVYANPWQFLESGAICAGYAGQMSAFLAEATRQPFYIAYDGDIQRLYAVLRIASLQRDEDLLRGKFNLTGDAARNHPWLKPFSVAAKPVEAQRLPSAAKRVGGGGHRLSEQLYSGSRYERMVGSGVVSAFQSLGADDIDDILHKPGRGARKICIFSRFEQARGGSELHALDLAERLRAYAEVELWSPTMCHASFTRSGLVRVIDPANGDLPAPGCIVVLVGLYFDLGPYMAQVDPFRIIALYNIFEAPLAIARIEALFRWTGVPVDLLYCSAMMADEMGLPGLFEPSPTDLGVFTPASNAAEGFVLGRHSRDVIEKHHPEDARVYRAVAGLGGRSVVLGGVSMNETFGPIDGLELLPATNKGIPEFLQSLSCYYYRTGTWVEPWGRVVIEALACGLPVVAHRLGGYAEAITHGSNGFLFDDTDEAIGYIRRLMLDADLRRDMGRKARIGAEEIVGPAAMRRLAAFYLFDPKTDVRSRPRTAATPHRLAAPANTHVPGEIGSRSAAL